MKQSNKIIPYNNPSEHSKKEEDEILIDHSQVGDDEQDVLIPLVQQDQDAVPPATIPDKQDNEKKELNFDTAKFFDKMGEQDESRAFEKESQDCELFQAIELEDRRNSSSKMTKLQSGKSSKTNESQQKLLPSNKSKSTS